MSGKFLLKFFDCFYCYLRCMEQKMKRVYAFSIQIAISEVTAIPIFIWFDCLHRYSRIFCRYVKFSGCGNCIVFSWITCMYTPECGFNVNLIKLHYVYVHAYGKEEIKNWWCNSTNEIILWWIDYYVVVVHYYRTNQS